MSDQFTVALINYYHWKYTFGFIDIFLLLGQLQLWATSERKCLHSVWHVSFCATATTFFSKLINQVVWKIIFSPCPSREEQCKDAIIKFNGRFYAGRQLQCEMCPVTRWKNAICGELFWLIGERHFHSLQRIMIQSLSCLVLRLSQVCLTGRGAPKGSTATSCMCSETLATNSGRRTGTCTCRRTAASRGAAGTGGTQSDTETGRGGNARAAEARRGPRGPTAGGTATGGGAGAERGGPPNGPPDTVTGRWIGTWAGAETGRGAGVETGSKTGRETGVEIKTGSRSPGIGVRRETVETKMQTRETGPEAQAERGRKRGEPRNRIGKRSPLMRIPTHIGATNNPRRARRRARRSTRRKAIRLGWRPRQESRRRCRRKRRRQISGRRVPVRR